MKTKLKKFSILGDSISTFQGYSPWGAEHYAPDTGPATGVFSVEDTWWMQVIQALGGELLSNLSISGNTVTTNGKMGGFPSGRIRQVAVDGVHPDHILLYAGLNDMNFYIPPQVFQAEYQQLLARLQAAYPQAEIHCGTLLLGAIGGDQTSMRPLAQRLVPYNEAICQAVDQAGCHLVDLAAMGLRYTSLDAFHPNGEGMKQLSSLWLQGMTASGFPRESQPIHFF